jgi:hypothetical protein
MLKALVKKIQYRKMNRRLDCDFYKRELSVSKVKNQLLEKSISDFVISWPDFDESFGILMFSQVGKRQFYDSTWCILYQQHGVIRKIKINREDTQSYEDLKQSLDRCTCLTDIMELDIKTKIYYD